MHPSIARISRLPTSRDCIPAPDTGLNWQSISTSVEHVRADDLGEHDQRTRSVSRPRNEKRREAPTPPAPGLPAAIAHRRLPAGVPCERLGSAGGAVRRIGNAQGVPRLEGERRSTIDRRHVVASPWNDTRAELIGEKSVPDPAGRGAALVAEPSWRLFGGATVVLIAPSTARFPTASHHRFRGFATLMPALSRVAVHVDGMVAASLETGR